MGRPGGESKFMTEATTPNIDSLQRRVPIVGDKAVIDLVNGLEVSRDILRYRRRQGVLGRMLGALTGGNAARQQLLDGNAVAGIEALHGWVLELSDTLRISQSALLVTQRSLIETRAAVRFHERELSGLGRELARVEEVLQATAGALGKRIDGLDSRLERVERAQQGSTALDLAVSSWAAGRTYQGLPWLVQVALLSDEVFSGPVGQVERVDGDYSLRRIFVNKVIVETQRARAPFSLSELLDETVGGLSQDDRELAEALLVDAQLRAQPHRAPTRAMLGHAVEFSRLPEAAWPRSVGRTAFELVAKEVPALARVTDTSRLIEQLASETADERLADAARASESDR